VRKFLFALMITVLPAAAGSSFAWKHHADGRLELIENGKTALVYNDGPQLKPGVPEDRRRCCYLFPVYTPGGTLVLDDFPKDHYHHRGLFWAWPTVGVDGHKYDSWMVEGLRERIVPGSLRWRGGTFEVVNGWYTGEKQVVREHVKVTVRPTAHHTRTLDVQLRFEAAGSPVTLRGSDDANKSYGGFCARFAPREETVIRTDQGVLPDRDDLHAHQWAELEGVYQGRRAALRITPSPSNPGLPYQWCLRPYGFVGASFPGKTAQVSSYAIHPGKLLVLAFRVDLTDK